MFIWVPTMVSECDRFLSALALTLMLGMGMVQTAAAQPAGLPANAGIAAGTVGQPAAELRSVSGVVFTQKPNAEVVIASRGAKLAVGDTIGTQKGAFALLVFNDGSRVALRPESALLIRGFSFKADDPTNDQLSVQLVKGWLRNVSGQIGKRGNEAAFDMKVSDTTIGIRGTDFAVRLCDEECAGSDGRGDEGVLPQSGRLGQVLSTERPLQRVSALGVTSEAPVGSQLILGDVVSAPDAEALLGLDDGTRLVLSAGARIGLRAEEDERGRRAIRMDVKEGTVRIATPPQPGARLYGLLVNAGELIGIRQDTAVDIRCDSVAAPTAFACAAATAELRRGRSEILSDAGLRSLMVNRPTPLLDPSAPASTPNTPSPGPSAPASPASPNNPGSGTLPVPAPTGPANTPSQGQGLPSPLPRSLLVLTPLPNESWDTWAPGHDPRIRWRKAVGWDGRIDNTTAPPGHWSGVLPPLQLAQLSPGTSALGAPSLPRIGGRGLDPLDIPVDAARPPGANERPSPGVYTAVFEGRIALSKPTGQIIIPAGQGGFAPAAVTLPPRPLPAAPAFMERDKELDRSKLTPDQCAR